MQSLTAGTTGSDVTVGGLPALTANGEGMTVTVTDIDEDTPPNGTDYKMIEVKLKWTENNHPGRDMVVDMVSYKAL